MSFSSYGLRIGLRVNRPDTLVDLAAHLPPGSRPSSSPVVKHLYSLWIGPPSTQRGVRHFHKLYLGAARLARTTQLDDLVELLGSHLDLVVATEAHRHVFVHAGVVGWRGKAILVPGRSLSGKTELVAALLRAGAVYYSDEYAVLDTQGRVHPYPRPLALRQAGERSGRVSAPELGALTGTKPLPVGLVVVTEYHKGAVWRPRPLSAGRAALALLTNTIPARTRPDAALAILREVTASAVAIKSRRGDAEAIVEPLLEFVHGN